MSATELLGRYGQADRAMALYGLGSIEDPTFLYGITPEVAFNVLDGHTQCWISKFCRNPLHPGPCKGWKQKLGQVAPGVLNMLEADRKAKLAKKQAAKAAAKKVAAKAVDKAKRGVEVDAHPAAKKKMGAKLAAQVLAEDADKAEAKAKLTQKEMAWHAQKKASALLAANMAAGNLKGGKASQQKYKQYVRAEIMKALKADNETGATGPDSEYQKTIAKLSQAISTGHGDKHVEPTGEDDFELVDAVSQEYDKAIQQDLADATAGKDPGNVKALTKKLDGLPGEPGSDEKKEALAKEFGVELKKKEKPFDEGAGSPAGEQAPGGMSPKEAKKFATAWGKIAQVIGVPKSQWAALKLKAEKAALAGGDPMNDPMIQESIQKAVDALVANASWHAYGWAPEAKEILAKAYAEEIAAQLKKGGTKLEEGGLLDLANKLKTGKISSYHHQGELEKKLNLPMKGATPGPADGSTGIPKNKIDDALDDAFGPNDGAPIKITTGVKDVTPASDGGSGVGTPKNDGGAGAGGPGKATKAGNAFGEMYAEIYGDGPDEYGTTPEGHAANITDELANTSDFEGDVSVNAGVLTAELVSQLDGADSLTLDEKAALAKHLKPMIAEAMKTGDASKAKTMAQSFKAMGAPQIKAVAKAMKQNLDDGAKPDQDGGASSPSPITTVSTQQKAEKMMAGFAQAATQLDPDSAKVVGEVMNKPENVKLLADSIDAGKVDPVAKIKVTAASMAPKIVEKKSQQITYLTPSEKAALSADLADAVAEQVATGQPHPLVTAVAEATTPKELTALAKAAKQKNDKGVMGQLGDALKSGDLSTLDEKITKGLESPVDPGAGAPTVVPPVSDDLFKHAGLNPKLYGGLVDQYKLAVSQGDVDNAAEALEGLSTAMAKEFAAKNLTGFGFATADEQALAGEILDKIAKDYLDAITSGADAPGGLVADLPAIVKGIEMDAKQLQADNGWTNPSPSAQKALDSFKGSKLLMATGALSGNLDSAHTKPPTKKGGPPAGAGGTATAPAAPVITTPPPASAPAKAAKKTAAKKAPAKKAAPKKGVPAAAVAAGKGIKPTAKMHGVQVVATGPQGIHHGAPVSSPVHQNGQTVLPPEGIYPISQVIVDGRESEVADYNAAVNGGLQGKEAAQEPRNFSELTGAQSSAVYNYSASGYHEINGHLRPPNPGTASENPGSGGSGSAPVADRVAHMDRAFNGSRITTPITTLRGFRGSANALGALWTQHRDQSWAGAEFRDLGYSSSSVNMGTARSFGGAGGPDAVIMRIHMPVGTRAINLVGQGAHGGEAEILLNRGARLRIVADNGYQNGARHLDVEVICESDDCTE